MSLVTRVFFFLFLVFLILLVTTLHLIPQLVSSIFDLLVPRVFFYSGVWLLGPRWSSRCTTSTRSNTASISDRHLSSPHNALHVLCCGMVSQTSLGWFLSEEKFVWLSLGLAIDRNVDQLLEKFSGSFERCVHDARDFWVRCRRWFSDLRLTVEAIGEQPVESGSPFRQITVVYLPFEEHTRKIHLQNVVEAGKNGPQSSLDVIRHPYVRQHWRWRFSLHRPWLNKPNPWMTCLTCRLHAHKVWRRHDLGPFECSQSEDCQFTLPFHNDDDQWTRRRSKQDFSFHEVMSTDQHMRKLGCLHRGERWLDDRRCSCWKKFNLFPRLATTWKNQKRGKFWHAFQIWRAAPESQVLDDFFAACARTGGSGPDCFPPDFTHETFRGVAHWCHVMHLTCTWCPLFAWWGYFSKATSSISPPAKVEKRL